MNHYHPKDPELKDSIVINVERNYKNNDLSGKIDKD
jgi:hypothetical protein